MGLGVNFIVFIKLRAGGIYLWDLINIREKAI